MKHLFLIAALCAVTVLGLEPFSKDVDGLIERGKYLIEETNKIIAEHQANERGHLLMQVHSELADIERLVKELGQLEAKANTTSYIRLRFNLLEEQLLHSEHRLDEELDFLYEVYKNHNATSKNSDELLEYGAVLIKEAQKKLDEVKTGGLSFPEIPVIVNEVEQIEKLLTQVEAVGSSVTANDEHILARHEFSLRGLLAHFEIDHPQPQ